MPIRQSKDGHYSYRAGNLLQYEKKGSVMQQKITEIQERLKTATEEERTKYLAQYQADTRKGVQRLVAQYQNQRKKQEAEFLRMKEMQRFDRQYDSFGVVCGVDEAGRGPLAGPVVAAAVILQREEQLLYLNDSKQVTEKRRETLYHQILEQSVSYGIGIVSQEQIDQMNILQATYEAMRQAIQQLKLKPDLLLNDAVKIPHIAIQQHGIIGGDAKSRCIAAASILAKVTRDHLMVEYDKQYPMYGFAKHKGYGTKDHILKLKQFGPCPLHRKTFIQHFL